MRVIVTRPARDAAIWVDAMAAAGLDAMALPLIAVCPVEDREPLHAAWGRMSDYTALMFVSGNAVEHFFAEKPPLAPVFIAQSAIKIRAFATGPGTVSALLQAGVPAVCIDSPAPDAGQFDSEALWGVVGGRLLPGQRVLIVRGRDSGDTAPNAGAGRDWFANRVLQAGAQVDLVTAYQRCLPPFGPYEQKQADDAATDGSVWLFSSSQAIANLVSLMPRQHWRAARAVATHPRIALAARQAGFGVVCESRPTLVDVLASIELMA
jgi:uroporphyrinogen-III synthase